MHRNKSVSAHSFAMVPRAEIPRSSFRIERAYKTAFDSGYLVPIFCEEVLPGDTARVKMTAFARLATPVFPLMDNLWMDSFFFFVPNRLTWANWRKFNGEQDQPGDSISYVIPQIVSPVGGYPIGTVYDYFGLPTVGQVGGASTVTHSALPIRAYALIYNQWFRDENLSTAFTVSTGDGPDLSTAVALARRGKRHDYFTSALPWPQKGGTAVSLPLGTSATVRTFASDLVTGNNSPLIIRNAVGGAIPTTGRAIGTGNSAPNISTTVATITDVGFYPTNLYADLSTATAATINQIRQAFQIQRLLERDARGGTRYTEIIRAHFGVISPDARLQRPEYLGGGSTPITLTPIAQTSGTGASGTTAPLGNLAAIGTLLAHGHGFSQSFTEHGYIIGIVQVRADLNYQQGLRRHWSRSTRYDFYWPVFANLGEQTVLNKEIYIVGTPAQDDGVFGYQERWAEYRYSPSEITGIMRSTAAGSLEAWHLAQKFTALPALNATFINDTPPVSRVIAVPSAPQFIFDSVFDMNWVRPLPMYSVPGLIDHF